MAEQGYAPPKKGSVLIAGHQ
ncbi:MAG: hypothetical protein QOD54_1177, partial [Sphingomonadales bacterium]|nr:hypothetical protein [Sphingomonadales bacterium]